MNRGEDVVLHDALADEDRVLIIVAVPRHEGDEHIFAERQFAELGRWAVGDDVAGADHVADLHQRTLVDAGRLVRALELLQAIDVDARLAGLDHVGRADDDTRRVDLVDHAAAARRDRRARIAGDGAFHAGADHRRLGAEQRHRLTLHVRSHQRAVGVIVFEERDQRGRDRNELLRRHVHQRDLLTRRHQEFARLARRDQLVDEAAVGVEVGVRLRDRVLRFLHRRQIDNLVGHLAVDDLAIRRLDEAIFVDAREGREAVDQTDVRAFRRFDRTDAAIMGRMNVADLETRALAGQTARPERRHAALVRHFGQRVGLIHELRKLRRAEEFAHRGDRGLRVDQVVRHHRRHVDRRHALLDRALHAEQADAILVLEQFADRTHAAVAEIVDIVDLALAVLQVHQFLDHGEDVLAAQRRHRVLGIEAEAHVELDAAHGRQVVAFGIEEEAAEQGLRRLTRRRFAGAHDAVDVTQRLVAILGLVGLQRVADPGAGVVVVDVEQDELVDPRGVELFEILGGHFVAGLDIDFAGGLVDQVIGAVAAEDFLGRDQQRVEPVLRRLVGETRADLVAGGEDDFAGLGVDDVEGGLRSAPVLDDEGNLPAVFGALEDEAVIEGVEDFLARHAQRIEQAGDRQLALAVDADVDDVLGVEFEVEPRAAIGDHARGEQELARRVGLAAVMVEQHTRRTVHLRHDDALGAVDEEGAVLGHERHVAHVNVLLLDIEHRTGVGFAVDLEDDQAQRDLHRRRIGDAALAAFLDVVLRRLEFVVDEVELGGAGEIADRENAAQRLLKARNITDRRIRTQELLIGFALHLDEVGHLHRFVDVAEQLTDSLACGCFEGLAHRLRLGRHK